MDEVRGRVVAHAAPAECERHPVHPVERQSGKPDVDRPAGQVQAVRGDARAAPHQPRIVAGGPESGDHVDLVLTAQPPVHRGQELDHAEVDRADLSAEVTPQDAIQRLERGPVVAASVIPVAGGE